MKLEKVFFFIKSCSEHLLAILDPTFWPLNEKYVFTQPLYHKQDATQSQFLSEN